MAITLAGFVTLVRRTPRPSTAGTDARLETTAEARDAGRPRDEGGVERWIPSDARAAAIIDRRRLRADGTLGRYLSGNVEGCAREVLGRAEQVVVVAEAVPVEDFVLVGVGTFDRAALVACARERDPGVSVSEVEGVTRIVPTARDGGGGAMTVVAPGAVIVGPVRLVARVLDARGRGASEGALGPLWTMLPTQSESAVRAAWWWSLPRSLAPYDAVEGVAVAVDGDERAELVLRCRDAGSAVRVAAHLQEPDAGAPVQLEGLRVEGSVVRGRLRTLPTL